MKNNKILKTLATLTMGVATAVGLCFGTTACGHKHSYSEDWSSDGTQHWHDATCKHTDEKSELGDHVGIEDGVCDICLYEVPVASVDVTASATSVKVGGRVTVSTSVLPTNAADKTITYTSSDTSVATVSSAGEVVGVKAGSVTITATSVNGKTDTVSITVTSDPSGTVAVTGVTLSKEELSLTVGGSSETLTATVAPQDADNKNVTWKSSDETIATVVNGTVTAVAAGTATITVTTVDGSFEATCSVTVSAGSGEVVAVTGVTLSKEELSLTVGGSTETLTATVAPQDANNKNVTWKSSDETIATVVNGTVTAVGAGTATITVTTVDGRFEATCSVTVSAATVAVTGVTLNKDELTLDAGGSETLIATVAPEGANNKNVTWKTSDATVATVVNGKVTAVKAGTATITVTTADGGFEATCAVTVNVAQQLSEDDFKAAVQSSLDAKSMTVDVDSEEGGEMVMKLDAVNYIVYSMSSRYDGESYSTFDAQSKNEVSYSKYKDKWVKYTSENDYEDADEWINDYKMQGIGSMLQLFTQVEYSSITFDADTGKYTLAIPQMPISISITIADGKISAMFMGKDVYTLSDYNNTVLTLPENSIDYIDLSSSASYKGTIGVGRETTIELEVTKEEDGSAYEGPIYFESSDETVATVDENGKVTGIKAGKCEITASTDFCRITSFEITVSADVSIYDELANTSNTLWSDDFNGQKDNHMPEFESWGKPGVYAEKPAEGKTHTLAVNEAGELVQTITGNTNYGAYIDFGPVREYVEGYLELKVTATGTKWNIVQFKDSSNKTVFVIGTGVAQNDTKLYYAVGDKVHDGTNLVEAAHATDIALKATTNEATNVYKIYYKIDLTTGKVILEIGDKKFEAESEISALAGIYIPASSSGTRTVILDNIAICGKLPPIEEYRPSVIAQLNAEYIKYVGKGEDETPAVVGTHTYNAAQINEYYGQALNEIQESGHVMDCMHILSNALNQFKWVESDAVIDEAREGCIAQIAIDFPAGNYTLEENEEAYGDTVQQATQAINGLNSTQAIYEYYYNYVCPTLQNIPTDAEIEEELLANAKQNAINELDNYTPPTVSDEIQAQIDSIIAQAKEAIEVANTVDEVNELLGNAQSAIELKVSSGTIDGYKTASITELNRYANAEIAKLNTNTDSALISAIYSAKSTGETNINAVSGDDYETEINTALNSAKQTIAGLVAADTLAKEKVSKAADLQDYYDEETADDKLPEIPSDKQTALGTALEDGLDAIEAAEDVDAVGVAYDDAVDAINGIIDQIKALKYEITVKGLEEDIKIEVVYGNTLTEEAVKAYETETKIFKGLYTNEAHDEEYDYATKIYAEDTLYAVFADAKINTVNNSFNWADISNTLEDQAVLTQTDLTTGANSFLKLGETGVKYRTTTDNTKTGVTTKTGGTGGIVQTNGEGLIVTYEGTGTLTISVRADGDSKVSGFAVKGPDGSYIAAKTATNSSFKSVGGNVYTITGSAYSSIEFEIKSRGEYTICFISGKGDGGQLRIAGISQVDKTKEEVVGVSSVTISAADDATTVEAYKTLQLTATVGPEDAEYKTLTWTSSDDETATVNENGLVTAIKVGTVTITATAVSGVSATYDIEVTASPEVRHALKFMLNDGTEKTAYPLEMVKEGDAINKPATDPTRDGYTFTGWYTTAAATTAYTFTDATMGESDVTIYAGWEEIKDEPEVFDVSDLTKGTALTKNNPIYDGDSFELTISDGATVVEHSATANDDSGLTFSKVILGGGNRVYTVTAKEDITVTVYFVIGKESSGAVASTSSSRTPIITVADEDISWTEGNTTTLGTAYAYTATLKQGETLTLKATGDRTFLYGVVAK